ncbi:MAG: DNA-3-methyladenine glycosylase [Hymenobacteraceae bacterium]|nr:DNA-3-methyladenine glycosylase [Hymenobacteraceae bacterium]
MAKLKPDYFYNPDVVAVSRDLLGKYIFSDIDGIVTGGMIVETEAYCGRNDKACHANNGRRTTRTEIMYQQGGVAYVYLIYGIYSLINVVTNTENMADAVLIRAIEPVQGVEEMLLRRNLQKPGPRLSAGPGLVAQALGITTKYTGTSLTGSTLWLEDRGTVIQEEEVLARPRVGVAYAQEDALRPWRFSVKGNKWVSKAK